MTPAACPLSALAAISGLETAQGLKSLGDDLDAYQHLLRRYAGSHAADMTQLRACLAAGEREEARRLAHTLKGIAGNLGAVATQRLAAELEDAIKTGHTAAELETQIAATASEIERLSAAILATLPAKQSQLQPDAVDWPQVQRIVDVLAEQLASSSLEANLLFEEHAALLKAALGPPGDLLAQQIGDYLYPEALTTLARWRAAAPAPSTPIRNT
jgi:two-component system sensor histidine kinase/response regulator